MSPGDMPTQAEARYLQNAQAVTDAGRGKGNGFHESGPGRSDVGDRCRMRGWIDYVDSFAIMLRITTAGRAALRRYKEAHNA